MEHIYNKHFTLDEARRLLPVIRSRMKEIRQVVLKLEEEGFDVYRGRYKPGFHPDTFEELPETFIDLHRLLHEVKDFGVEIKGLEQGLIDFPALRDDGQEVFLCWKLDEDDIEFWHELKAGFRGRRHIDEF